MSIDANDHLRDKVTRLEEQLKAVKEARELQANEYERRLHVLNGAHEEAVRVLATYLPREIHDSYVRETTKASELAKKELQSAMGIAEKQRERIRTDAFEALQLSQKEQNVRLQVVNEALDKRLEVVERFRDRAALIGIGISVFAGLIGAAIMRAFGQ